MKTEFGEFFFSDPTVEVDGDGLIWKPMLPVGVWKVGPNGRPLKVIPGSNPEPRRVIGGHQVVGLKDIVDAFNDGAISHVTIPKTHNDEVDENTGQVKKIDIRNYKGVPTLFGGHDITDQAINFL